MRQGLNNLDLSSNYLNKKKDLTECEKRVLEKIEKVENSANNFIDVK